MTECIHFTLNGRPTIASAAGAESLLSFLRGDAALTGTKKGCDAKSCGACTVLVDGKTRKACSQRLTSVHGKSVETIEGLAAGGELHAVQQAFLATAAYQCGFCTPGMIMAIRGLLNEHPDPTEEQIRRALRSNLCRCTGYSSIVEAAKLAAQLARSPLGSAGYLSQGGVGESMVDLEGVEKVTGALLFADDYRVAATLVGKLVWSEQPHARIVHVDTTRASLVRGVRAVFTAKDIPGVNGIGWSHLDQPVLAAERVCSMGDPVAVVVADDDTSAESGRAALRVEYDPLPVITSPTAALAKGAPELHRAGNVVRQYSYAQGVIDEALAEAPLVVEGEFTTPFVEHAYLEPESVLARVEEGGVLSVLTGTQYPFEVRECVASVLDLPAQMVRVVVPPLGGAFGGKTDVHPCVPAAALAAYRLGRPVRITLDRRESLLSSTKRHASALSYRAGFDREGHLLAVDAHLLYDAGPYTGQSDEVIEQACIFACGPYRVPTYRVTGRAVHTNNALGGAFRGYGINQVSFAMESLMDQASRELGIDPVEIRLRNVLKQGDVTAAGEKLQGAVGARRTLEALCDDYRTEIAQESSRPGWKRGVGVASAYKNVGWGRGSVDDGTAVMRVREDGSIHVLTVAPDMGQGIRTVLTQIARDTLGPRAVKIEVGLLDTLRVPHCNGGSAERLTFCTGNAVLGAAVRLKHELAEAGLELLGNADASFADIGAALALCGRSLEIEETYAAPRTFSLAQRAEVPEGEFRLYPAYSYTSSLAVVEVEEQSGNVKVLKMNTYQDVGRALNPQIIVGQIHGSCMQALGYTLSEEFAVVKGRPVTLSFGALGIPSIADTPEYRVVLIESPDEHGPLGARGISEVAIVPACPALATAITNATGQCVNALPVAPRRRARTPRRDRERSHTSANLRT